MKLSRKNKMVMALALATAGVVAAGATSTVAWFTANREVSLTYSNIQILSNQGDLRIGYGALINGIGGGDLDVTASTNRNPNISVSDTVQIHDVSSGDGEAFVAPVWTGNNLTFESQTWTQNDTKYYVSQFYVSLYNSADATDGDKLEVYLNGADSWIHDEDTGVANFARVAMSATLSEDQAPSSGYRNDNRYFFMDVDEDAIGNEGKYATSSTEAVLHGAYIEDAAANGNGCTINGSKIEIDDQVIEQMDFVDYLKVGDQDYTLGATSNGYTYDADAHEITLTAAPGDAKVSFKYSWLVYDSTNGLSSLTEGTDYYRDVNGGDLDFSADSVNTDANFIAELDGEETAYVVFTVWFEGTEKNIQNENLLDIFSLKLAFSAK